MSSKTQKGLTRGAQARFYRDGGDLHSGCEIPAAGAFVVRTLPPGQWVCKDSRGGEQAFTVTPFEESTVILSGDVIGASGEAATAGVVAVEQHQVGLGGGIFTSPDQVAAGETVTGTRRTKPGELEAELVAAPGRPEPAYRRPKDPTSDERVSGQAGAGFAQDVPIRDVAAVVAEAERRAALGEDDRALEQLEAEDNAIEVPKTVVPADVGPAPERPTTLRPGEGASATATPTPLDGRVEGDPQPQLGADPEKAAA